MPTCFEVKLCGTGPASCGPLDAPGTGNTLVYRDVPPEQCPGFILMTHAEIQSLKTLPDLSMAEANSLLTSILVLWAIAWGWRTIARQIKEKDDVQED
ncbi:hypothetical protein [Chitinolyticbacter meiyuanensis]|uniref:hypothetical protein n=1 Tax=Chitinolyticbacter meiyuanensis TaxID=682798 RepID=UPI0011E5AAEF|nr:hypothetical protein [Chitinolyticbacter meiyuanensis]